MDDLDTIVEARPSKRLRINHPGDGLWIMTRVNGVFTNETDQVIANHRDGQITGGFVLCGYLGAAMTVHMAGEDERWCSRDLLWMVFDYAFNQLGLRVLIAPVRSKDRIALKMNIRAGWFIEAVIKDAYPDADLVLLTMTKDSCRWLRDLKPKEWKSNLE